jgi:DNA mismatch endonuclease (patch repair protein)
MVAVTDIFSKSKRSQVMSRIRGRDTKPEIAVRSILHGLGYRFRIHAKSLPGKPDVVLTKHRVVIMVHGCFWHRHQRCRYAYTPKSRVEFWRKKFLGNALRDQKVEKQLRMLGWRVIKIWECEVRSPKKLTVRVNRLLSRSKSDKAEEK